MNKEYINKDNFYFCYSLQMFHFLKLNNFYYEYKETLPETRRYVWVFPKTHELMEAVSYYIKNSKKK